MIFDLQKKLSEWTVAGLITRAQASAIGEHEGRGSGRRWMLYGFAFLGVFTIAIGVISIIAANWEWTPWQVKLLGNLSLLLAAAGAAIYYHDERPVVFEAALAALALFALGSIGLISQVFHTDGEFYEASGLWCVISFSLALISQRLFLPLSWVVMLIVTVYMRLDDSKYDNWPGVILGVPIVFGVVAQLFRLLRWHEHLRWSFEFCAFWVLLGTVWSFDFARDSGQHVHNMELAAVAGACGLTFLNAFLIFMRSGILKVQRMMVVGGALAIVALVLMVQFTKEMIYIRAALSIVFMATTAVFFGVESRNKVFTVLVVLIGVRVFGLYLDAFGGLLQTGIGLVVSGVVFLMLVYFFNRWRQRVLLWIEGLR